jgi:hypothetical protein
MVVCDDRDVMRLGPVKMLQAIQRATDLKGLSSSPAAWNYRPATSLPTRSRSWWHLSSRRAKGDPAAARPWSRPGAVAAGLPVDGYFLEEDLSASVLRAVLTRLDERKFPRLAPMAEFLLGRVHD